MGVRAGARGARHRQAPGALRPVHRRPRRRGVGRGHLHDRRPVDRAPAGRWSRRPPPPTSTARCEPRKRAGRRRWTDLPGRERAKYLFRIARILQERSREFAVLESMDSGQADQGEPRRRRAARGGALLVLRGLGRQARVRVPGPRRAAARRRRPGHPVELPAAHAGVEDRARAGRRQHGRPQAGLDHAPDGAPVRRGVPPGRPAARRREHRPGARRDRHGARHPHRTSPRSRSPARPRSARRSTARSPAPTRRSPSSSAARPPTSCSRTRRSIRRSRAS